MSVIAKHGGEEILDAEPIQRAIRRDAQEALADAWYQAQPNDKGLSLLADRTGIQDRTIRRILAQKHVRLDVADRYCCATNRCLYDLYPELRDEAIERDSFLWWCKTCRTEVDQDVLHENHNRMVLRCPDCGRQHHAERHKRGAPANCFPSLPVTTAQLIAEYRAGATGTELAAKHGFHDPTGVYRRLAKAGEPRRNRANNAGGENLAAHRAERSATARERAAKLREMWVAGTPTQTIADELGITTSHVKSVRAKLGLPRRLPGGRGWA